MDTCTSAVWCKVDTKGDVPIGRSSNGLVVIGRCVYIFGGENQPRVPIGSTIHCLNLDNMEWSECKVANEECIPTPINAASVCAIDKTIYVFGGRTGITMGEGSTNDMFSFNTQTGEWLKLQTTGERPLARSYHTMVAMDKKLYMFGGCSEQGRMNDMFSFDVASHHWEKQPDHNAIEGRGGPGLVAVGDSVYVIAGFAGKEMNDVHKFNTVTKSWSTLSFGTSLPRRSVFGCATDGRSIVVIGGEIDPSDKGHEGAGQFSNECFTLSVRDPTNWVKMSVSGRKPEQRGWFPAVYCSANKKFIIFGGNSETNDRLNDTYLFEIKYE